MLSKLSKYSDLLVDNKRRIVLLIGFIGILVALFYVSSTFTWFTHKDTGVVIPFEIGKVGLRLAEVDMGDGEIAFELENESNDDIYLRVGIIPVVKDASGMETTEDVSSLELHSLTEGWQVKTVENDGFVMHYMVYGEADEYAILEPDIDGAADEDETEKENIKVEFEYSCETENQLSFYILPEAIQGTADALEFFSSPEYNAWPW